MKNVFPVAFVYLNVLIKQYQNIPIADTLINSIAQPLYEMSLEFEYSVRTMTDEDRNGFLQLEAEAWKG